MIFKHSSKTISVILILCLICKCDSQHALSNDFYDLKSVSFQDCGSKYEILHLSISSCTKIPCKMKLGSYVSFFAEFDDYGDETAYLKHHVQWTLHAVNSEAMVTPDQCDIKEQCPFQGFVGKAFFATLHVTPNLPAVVGSLRWEARNHKGNKVICYKVPIAITWF